MKIVNNDFYTNNWQDFVHRWVMQKVDHLVQRYDLPVDVDTIESFRIQTNEVGTHDFVFAYTKDGVEHTLTITPKNNDVEISISDNSTWVVNGEDTGKNTAGQMGSVGERGPQGVRGDKGPQGLKGKTGVQGLKGERGKTGDKGPTGEIGEQGPQGLQGNQGLQGEDGERGDTGPQGEQGPLGEQGLKGEIGDKGPQGIAGTITGEKGPTGPVGLKGETGDKGPTGSKGPQGVIGETGDKGPTGDRGEQGPQGDQGPEGPQGPIGEKGPKGDTVDVNITLNNDGNFYVNDEDSGKPWRGLPGKITGLTENAYKNQLWRTIGEVRESKLSKYNFSCESIKYRNDNGGSGNCLFAPNNSDVDYSIYHSLPSNFKIFATGYTSASLYKKSSSYGDDNLPLIYSCNVMCFGFNLGNILSYTSGTFSFENTQTCTISTKISIGRSRDIEKLYNNYCTNYFYKQYMLFALSKGIIKVTDPSGNMRTFQPKKITLVFNMEEEDGRSVNYRLTYQAYTQGPQAQWSNTFDTTEDKYNYKIEIIDNDGNPVDCTVMNCPLPTR